ncbi:hypothetical protein F5Y14DRAFT_422690 [Nemania sp. NC0429]|nr:hypothetical protein F5Y14DRAFT_422690 [Nemania sp. NC0429]
MNELSATDIDRIHNIILGIYLALFILARARQIRSLATAMADTLAPQTPPKKLFKPSSKTKTPTRPKLSPQTTRHTDFPRTTASDAPPPIASEPEARGHEHEASLDSIVESKPTQPAARTEVSATPDKLGEHAGSDTTGETSTGLAENYILTPAETSSRGTAPRSPLSRQNSRNAKDSPLSFKEKVSRVRELARESADDIAGKPIEALERDILERDVSESAEDGALAEADPNDFLNSPTKIAEYFKDRGNPEMSSFVSSLAGNWALGSGQASGRGSGENTPTAAKPQAGEAQAPNNHDNQANPITNDHKNDEPDHAGTREESQSTGTSNLQDPANVSKMASGVFRDSGDAKSIVKPTNNMGEPSTSEISQTSQLSRPTAEPHDPNGYEHEVDNMGRPAHVERSFEIPFQRQGREARSPLGDFEDLPSADDLPSTDGLPRIPEDDSQDPPEEILDPSMHSTSTSITPIPKIPKITPIDSLPPTGLPRLAQGLAGHVIDDVGNIIDESGEVLGHATGDLPAMVGKNVSDEGEVYGDGGEIIGYVSENFINPPSPTEIPGDVLGGLRVDHKGNILDSRGNIIGKFYEPPERNSSSPKPSAKPATPKVDSHEEEPREERKPKVNAHTGGSPSDLFLDVKSTTDGIQLTIRIPTTFSRSPAATD